MIGAGTGGYRWLWQVVGRAPFLGSCSSILRA
jgi:hypothetical protein